MLKNPVHFFRKDGKLVNTDLLTGRFLSRSPEVLLKINEALAFRHLVRNNTIKSIPSSKRHPELFHHYIFEGHNSDIRPEDPYYGDYRVAVSMNSQDLPSVISKCVEKKIRLHVSKFLIGKSGNQDLIIIPKNFVFFSNDSQIASEISLLFSKSKEYYSYKSDSKLTLNTEDLYYKIIKTAYQHNESEFFQNFLKVSQALNDPTSPISVIPYVASLKNNQKTKL